MYMCRYGIIPTARMTGIRFKTADATLEEFKILSKRYEVKIILKNISNNVLTSF